VKISPRKACCAILIIVLLATAILAQTRKASSLQQRQKTFEVIWKTINEKYFDPQFGGVDWNKVRERYEPRVSQTKGDDELFTLLTEMLSELKTSHLEVVPESAISQLKRPPVMVGISLKDIAGQAVIWRLLPNSSASESGLRTGFVIKKIDDTPINEVSDARKLMAGDPGTKLTVEYLNEHDELKVATLERRLIPSEMLEKQSLGGGAALYSTFHTERLADKIGYIQFSSFVKPLGRRVSQAIETMRDAPGLIIDLRGNGGGDDEVGLAMANMLFAKKTQLMISKTRKGDDLYYHAKPNQRAFLGPLVILLDNESGSASEQFAAGLQEVGRATVIGLKTAGEDMDADVKALPVGGFVIYPYGLPRTPKGVVIEGRGVIPDAEVSLTRSDLLQGKDSQLQAAIEFLRKQAAQK